MESIGGSYFEWEQKMRERRKIILTRIIIINTNSYLLLARNVYYNVVNNNFNQAKGGESQEMSE